MTEKTYFCDPQKNTQCDKTYCRENSNAKHAICCLTTNPDFAVCKPDGTPEEFYATYTGVIGGLSRDEARYKLLLEEGLLSENECRILCGMKPLYDCLDDFMIKTSPVPTETVNHSYFDCKWWLPISLTVINLITLGISLIRMLLL